MKTYITFLLLTLCSITSSSQSSRISVFLDCQTSCYMNYVKEQIAYVDYMQDRTQADVYILATSQRNGAGGREVQMVFEGNGEFGSLSDTLHYMIDPNSTDAIIRDQFVTSLKKGLLIYLVQTDLVDRIQYSVEDNGSFGEEETIIDPWNYWVFNVGGRGWMNGEESYSSIDLYGEIEANRVTDESKIEIDAWHNHSENTFTLSDGEELKTIRKSYGIYLEYVKSITPHWSLGGTSRYGSSTFGNTDRSTSVRAAIEYNIFPYSEAQTRRFSFFYAVGPEHYDYTEETIYDKLTEMTWRQTLRMNYQQTQKWGNIYLTLGVQQYLHDHRLYNAFLNPSIDWQIFKGFSLNLGGYFSFVNDRINISKDNITDEDILLQIKQLDTDFTYYSYFGINYRFGSKYNNYVNPRF